MKYLLCDYLDGRYDVKKTVSSSEDDLMCWAAAASNILAWSKWGFPSAESFTDATSIFQYFQDHWIDSPGHVNLAWQWWFNSISNPDLDIPGGGFWNNPYFSYENFYHCEYDRIKALSAIDQFLHNGWGVALNLISPNGGHCLTCWGYEYNEHGDYIGIYVTDSDDPLNSMQRYYELSQSGWAVGYPGWWYFHYYRDQTQYLIADVHALERYPGQNNSIPPSPPKNVKVVIG